jgi:hypothetical protein
LRSGGARLKMAPNKKISMFLKVEALQAAFSFQRCITRGLWL